jgi:hypothetical protein
MRIGVRIEFCATTIPHPGVEQQSRAPDFPAPPRMPAYRDGVLGNGNKRTARRRKLSSGGKSFASQLCRPALDPPPEVRL